MSKKKLSEFKKAIYPGSFDPITNGHINVIDKAIRIFDELHVVIAKNPNKKYFFDDIERYKLVKESLKKYKNKIIVAVHDGLIVDYAKNNNIFVLVRGLRGVSDFDYEFHMATINNQLWHKLNTIFITTLADYFYVNSSTIKELIKLNADISNFVPKVVLNALKEKIKN